MDFDNDHLFEFFVARNERASNPIRYELGNDRVFTTRIRDLLPLPPKNYLFYLFDYGDYWIFKLLISRKKPHSPLDDVAYPRVVKETGEKPIQYGNDDECDEW